MAIKERVYFIQLRDGKPLCDYQGIPYLCASKDEAAVGGKAKKVVIYWDQ